MREFACGDGSDAVLIDQELVIVLQCMKAHTYTPKNISAATVARTAVLGLALTNQLLSAAGKPVLPIESTQVEQLVSAGFTIGAALASWWYNNSFTQAAIKADEEFERQKKRV